MMIVSVNVNLSSLNKSGDLLVEAFIVFTGVFLFTYDMNDLFKKRTLCDAAQ